ncbi:MAG: hypothetical protein LBB47_04705 [Spirochaetaceae bacterium]|jgi:hypothetical protein|nr:hypothetical protein [Spirochaetaceae bacterium]
MKKKTLSGTPVLFLLFFINSGDVSAQADDNQVYYIREIYFDITGRTKEYALLLTSEIKKGDEIKGGAALREYIARKQQILINRRELQDAVIDFAAAEQDEDGRVPVDLTIHTVDTRNFVIVPEPKYSSNTGWEPRLRIRDFNFLGLMSPLRIYLSYRYHDGKDITYSRNNLSLLLGIETPFSAFGYDWKFITENIFSYYFDEPFSYGNTSGLSFDIPFKNTTLTFGYRQGVYFGEEYDNWRKYVYSMNFQDIWYGSSALYGEWKIPLPVETENLGKLTYKPAVSGNINYAFRDEDLAERNGPSFNASHRLGFDKIDWAGNFRRGAALYIENGNEYNFFFEEWSSSVTADITEHLLITDFLGISMRGRFTKWFYGSGLGHTGARWEAAGMIRGMGDYALAADSMLLFNFDFIFHVFNFMFSEYFNEPRLRIINMELQAGPIMDIALVDGMEVDFKRNFIRNITYTPRDWIVSGGIELFFFPLAFRSIYLCVSAAWYLNPLFNTGVLPGRDELELYMGFGHHF